MSRALSWGTIRSPETRIDCPNQADKTLIRERDLQRHEESQTSFTSFAHMPFFSQTEALPGVEHSPGRIAVVSY